VLRERCGGCHRVYPPGTMTAEMWNLQIDRMRAIYARRGIPWLAPDEERALHEYISVHAGTA
jgi:diheme cytochrome c